MPRNRNQPPVEDPDVRDVLADMEDADTWHRAYEQNIDRWYRTWRGVLEERSRAADYTSRLHPPYALQVAETLLANLVDTDLRFKVTARPRMDMARQDYIATLQNAARAHELLANAQMREEYFDQILDGYYLQNLIAGMTVAKNFWRREEKTVTRRIQRAVPSTDPFTGMMNGYQMVADLSTGPHVTYDGPVTEVVDMRDFWWNPAGAVELCRATSVTHRCWYTIEQLRLLESNGYYQNVDELSDTDDYSQSLQNREQALFQMPRTKGMVEVLEQWKTGDDGAITVTVVGNRKVLLAKNPNPFWHGDFPFVVCSTRPDQFRIPGVSEIETIAELQDALWTLLNSRIDATSFAVLPIVMFKSDFDDPDSFEFAPGARNIVDDPSQVVMWHPDPLPAQVSIPAENLIRSDIMNLSGAAPLLAGGASAGSLDNTTATGISLVTNQALRLIARKKQRGINSLRRVFDQRAWLNRQFVQQDQLVRVVGEDGATAWEQVLSEDLQHDCYFEFEPAEKGFMQQEARANANAMIATALQVMPFLAAQQQQDPTKRTLNLEALVEDWLRAWDVDQPDRYFSRMPQPTQMGGPQGTGQQPPQNGQGGVGITSPAAYGPLSPSNGQSMSPMAPMQQMLSQTGPRQ